jgi:hypothetical protein
MKAELSQEEVQEIQLLKSDDDLYPSLPDRERATKIQARKEEIAKLVTFGKYYSQESIKNWDKFMIYLKNFISNLALTERKEYKVDIICIDELIKNWQTLVSAPTIKASTFSGNLNTFIEVFARWQSNPTAKLTSATTLFNPTTDPEKLGLIQWFIDQQAFASSMNESNEVAKSLAALFEIKQGAEEVINRKYTPVLHSFQNDIASFDSEHLKTLLMLINLYKFEMESLAQKYNKSHEDEIRFQRDIVGSDDSSLEQKEEAKAKLKNGFWDKVVKPIEEMHNRRLLLNKGDVTTTQAVMSESTYVISVKADIILFHKLKEFFDNRNLDSYLVAPIWQSAKSEFTKSIKSATNDEVAVDPKTFSKTATLLLNAATAELREEEKQFAPSSLSNEDYKILEEFYNKFNWLLQSRDSLEFPKRTFNKEMFEKLRPVGMKANVVSNTKLTQVMVSIEKLKDAILGAFNLERKTRNLLSSGNNDINSWDNLEKDLLTTLNSLVYTNNAFDKNIYDQIQSLSRQIKNARMVKGYQVTPKGLVQNIINLIDSFPDVVSNISNLLIRLQKEIFQNHYLLAENKVAIDPEGNPLNIDGLDAQFTTLSNNMKKGLNSFYILDTLSTVIEKKPISTPPGVPPPPPLPTPEQRLQKEINRKLTQLIRYKDSRIKQWGMSSINFRNKGDVAKVQSFINNDPDSPMKINNKLTLKALDRYFDYLLSKQNSSNTTDTLVKQNEANQKLFLLRLFGNQEVEQWRIGKKEITNIDFNNSVTMLSLKGFIQNDSNYTVKSGMVVTVDHLNKYLDFLLSKEDQRKLLFARGYLDSAKRVYGAKTLAEKLKENFLYTEFNNAEENAEIAADQYKADHSDLFRSQLNSAELQELSPNAPVLSNGGNDVNKPSDTERELKAKREKLLNLVTPGNRDDLSVNLYLVKLKTVAQKLREEGLSEKDIPNHPEYVATRNLPGFRVLSNLEREISALEEATENEWESLASRLNLEQAKKNRQKQYNELHEMESQIQTLEQNILNKNGSNVQINVMDTQLRMLRININEAQFNVRKSEGILRIVNRRAIADAEQQVREVLHNKLNEIRALQGEFNNAKVRFGFAQANLDAASPASAVSKLIKEFNDIYGHDTQEDRLQQIITELNSLVAKANESITELGQATVKDYNIAALINSLKDKIAVIETEDDATKIDDAKVQASIQNEDDWREIQSAADTALAAMQADAANLKNDMDRLVDNVKIEISRFNDDLKKLSDKAKLKQIKDDIIQELNVFASEQPQIDQLNSEIQGLQKQLNGTISDIRVKSEIKNKTNRLNKLNGPSISIDQILQILSGTRLLVDDYKAVFDEATDSAKRDDLIAIALRSREYNQDLSLKLRRETMENKKPAKVSVKGILAIVDRSSLGNDQKITRFAANISQFVSAADANFENIQFDNGDIVKYIISQDDSGTPIFIFDGEPRSHESVDNNGKVIDYSNKYYKDQQTDMGEGFGFGPTEYAFSKVNIRGQALFKYSQKPNNSAKRRKA